MHALSHPAAWRRAGVCAVALILFVVLWSASAAKADFGIQPGTFSTTLSTDQAGAAVDLDTEFETARQPDDTSAGSLKDLALDLPAGIIGDATAVPQCKTSQLLSMSGCPVTSQVGTAYILFNYMGFPYEAQPTVALYNMEPPRGETAELAAVLFSPMISLVVHVRSDSDYGLTTTINNASDWLPVYSSSVKLWGIPSDSSHDKERGPCLVSTWDPNDACPFTGEPHAFLRNASTCGPQQPSKITVDSWQHPDMKATDTYAMPDITGCEKLPPVEPKAQVQPSDSSAGAPAGYDVNLDIPQVTNPNAVATPPLKKVSIDFPNGTAISPGGADGLAACTDEQLHQHDSSAVACPSASKIGTVSITTPFLPEPLEGSMYLGQPQPNDQFRLFLVADGSGVSVRLKGSAVPDAQTGHVRATFENLPQIAFSSLQVHMKGGPRAVLVNPTACGTATATTTVTPYGGGADASSANSFEVGGNCAAPGFSPALSAGTTNPIAGADSPFVLQIARADGQQDLKSVAVDLPAGLIGKVAGLPLCPAPSASCPESSRVGDVSVAVGTGSNPISLPGSVYMTQGFGAAPFGLAFVVPAKVGPFDFGTVVVPAGVQVDAFTGALHVQTGDMPSIIGGIPLHYRAVTVNLNRASFMRNPTSCSQKQIGASLASTAGAVATPSTPFAVAGCGDLPLKPVVKMTFNGAKERRAKGQPGLSVVLTQQPGESNLKAVAVTLPRAVGLSLGLPQPCTVAQFTGRNCPAASKLGDSSVTTPLLDGMLQGGVYLVAAEKAGQLPRLGVLLNGQVPISLLSQVSATKGHVTTTFTAPDLPISRFKLTLNTKTALTAAEDLCTRPQKSVVAILGASGARTKSTITVPVQGCSSKKRKSSSASKARKSRVSAASRKH